jgi:hypothetical protein
MDLRLTHSVTTPHRCVRQRTVSISDDNPFVQPVARAAAADDVLQTALHLRFIQQNLAGIASEVADAASDPVLVSRMPHLGSQLCPAQGNVLAAGALPETILPSAQQEKCQSALKTSQ